MLHFLRSYFAIWIVLIVVTCTGFAADCPVGDLGGDCAVGFDDLVMFAEQWLGNGGSANLDNIGAVNMADFSLFAGGWLTDNSNNMVVINELMAKNTLSIQDEAGQHEDWIELYNSGPGPARIGGMYLTDRPTEPDKWWPIPAGAEIPSGGYLIIWADGDPLGGDLHATFSLSQNGETVALLDSSGATIDSVTFGVQVENHSYGRFPDAGQTWRDFDPDTEYKPTPRTSNGSPVVDNTVVINEIMYHPSSENDLDEFIELYNYGTEALRLNGWQFTRGVDLTFPDVTLNAGSYLIVAADRATFEATYGKSPDVAGWTGVLSNKSDTIELVDATGRVVDKVPYADEGGWAQRLLGPVDHQHRGWEWSDTHDGLGRSMELVNYRMPNEYGQNWSASVLNKGTPGLVNSTVAAESAPLVTEVKHFPLIPRAIDDVSVTARIVDEIKTGLTVTLHYRLDGQPTFSSAVMSDDGNHDDGAAGDLVFGARIPARPHGSVMEFYVEARDASARARTWPAPCDVDGALQQAANVLYQVDNSYDPSQLWTPGQDPIYYVIMTEAQRAELADIGDDGDPFTGEAATNAQMNATFISIDGAQIQVRYLVGIRNRGNRSRVDSPNNYHLNFRADEPWNGITGLSVNSKYAFNEVLGSAIFRLNGLAACETIGVRFRVNGQDLASYGSDMYGLYSSQEVFDSDWASNHFPDDPDGNLYRCTYDTLHGSRTDAYLDYRGTDPADYYYNYVKETNEEENDWTDLFDLTYTLNDSSISDKDYFAEISRVGDITEWLRFMATDTMLGNIEGGLVTGSGDDYAMYRGITDMRFVLIPHDLDTLLNKGDHGSYNSEVTRSVFSYDDIPGLNRMLNNDDVVRTYFNEILDTGETTLSSASFGSFADQILGGWMPADQIADMKMFVVDRFAHVKDPTHEIFQNPLSVSSGLTVVSGFPHTTTDSFSLSGAANSVLTGSILVNGRTDPKWQVRQGTWTYGSAGGSTPGASETLVDKGSQWSYLDNNSNQGTAWRERTYDDSAWKSGNAQFGYSDGSGSEGDEATIINGGPVGSRYITTYFRQWFTVTDPGRFVDLDINILRDDGAMIYVNGVLVGRTNINDSVADADVNYQTRAQTAIGGADEDAFNPIPVDRAKVAGLLVEGDNLIAVEIHQQSPTSSDVSFDMELIGYEPGQEGGAGSLNPGVNRVIVQAFDGKAGTGKEVDRETIDIWYDDGTIQTVPATVQGNPVPEGNLAVTVRDSYLPGVPFVVRAELLNDDGAVNRDLWDAAALLSVVGNPNVTLSASEITIYNGLGTAFVTASGSGDFTLKVDLQGIEASKTLADWSDMPVTTVSGGLADSETWSGIYHITGGNFSIPAGVTLTLDAGTLLLIDGVASGETGTEISVSGAVRSMGTAQSPVTITAYSAGLNWGQFRHTNASPSTFEYTNITRAGRSQPVGHSNTGPVFRGLGSTLVFDHCNISDHPGKIMNLTSGCDLTYRNGTFCRSWMGPEIGGTALLLENTWIFDMHAGDDADAIYVHDQQAGQECIMRTGVIANMDDDGLDTLGCDMTIEDFIVRDINDKGISVNVGQTTIKQCLVVETNKAPEDPTVAAIAAKGNEGDTAIVYMDRSTVVSSRIAGATDYGIQSHDKYGVTNGQVIWYVTNSVIDATDPIKADEPPYLASDIHVDYSNAYDEVWPGTGNINADPMFVDQPAHNYRLQADSPCIDTGDPVQTDPDASRADMGYYPYEAAAAGGKYIAIWTADQGPYRISGTVTVPQNLTLKIMPGTTVFFDNNSTLTVRGRLVAEGTEYEQIRFTRTPGSTGYTGIQFADTMEDNRIVWAIVEYGVSNLGMIGLDNSKLLVEHVTLDHTDRRRIRSIDSSLIVRNCVFTDIFGPGEPASTNNLSEHIWGGGIPAGGVFLIENNVFGTTKGHNDAIDFDGGFRPDPIAQIIGNVFMGSGDDLLDLETDAHIEGNIFQYVHKDIYNNDPGESNIISAGSGHHFVVVRNVFYDVGHITLIKENSFMDFVNNTVVDADLAALYFDLAGQTSGPGRGAYVDGCIFVNCPTIFSNVLPATELTVNRSMINETELALGVGNIVGNAWITNPAGGDFSLLGRSPAIGAGPDGIDMGADVPAGAILSGEPSATWPRTTATLNVHGPELTHYMYRLNNEPWSDEYAIDTPLAITGLSNGGSYTLGVIAKNSAGAWQGEGSATMSGPWTVDTSYQTLIINEVLAQSRTTPMDMIELYYDGAVALDAGGFRLSDNADKPGKYTIPAGAMIGPDSCLVLYADDDPDPYTNDGKLYTGFKLDGDGDQVFLYNRAAQGDTPIDSVAFGKQISDMSVGRIDGQWCLNVPTFGNPNVVAPTGDPAELCINEWLASEQMLYNEDFIELYNADDLPVDISGMYLTDNNVSQKTKHRFGALNFIGAVGYMALDADGQDQPGHVNFRLSSRHEILALYDARLDEIDKVVYYDQTTDVSQGRAPDGAKAMALFTTPTPGYANVDTVVISEVLSHSHAEAFDMIELYNTTNAPIDIGGWFLSDSVDDLKKYEIPQGTIIYPDNPAGTDDYYVVSEELFGDPNAPGTHTAFALSENGESVILSAAQNGVLTGYRRKVDFKASATGVSFGRYLTASGAYHFVPMAATTEDGPNDAGPQIGPIVISEIMYNSGDPDVEYIEFYNVGAALTLQARDNVLNQDIPWAITNGVDYTFEPGTGIAAGERFLVVKDKTAFQTRYPNVPVGTKLFEWMTGGSLDNNGETIEISLPGDVANDQRLYISVDRVRYDNTADWPDTTDGTGRSLNRVNLSAYGNDVSNWTDAQATPGL